MRGGKRRWRRVEVGGAWGMVGCGLEAWLAIDASVLVRVADNGLGDEGGAKVAAALAQNTTLLSLNLRSAHPATAAPHLALRPCPATAARRTRRAPPPTRAARAGEGASVGRCAGCEGRRRCWRVEVGGAWGMAGCGFVAWRAVDLSVPVRVAENELGDETDEQLLAAAGDRVELTL